MPIVDDCKPSSIIDVAIQRPAPTVVAIAFGSERFVLLFDDIRSINILKFLKFSH